MQSTKTVRRILAVLVIVAFLLPGSTLLLLEHTPGKFLFPLRVWAQNVFELTCPAGTSSIQSMQTTNNITGKGRQNFCVDNFGNLMSTGAITLSAGTIIDATNPAQVNPPVKANARWVNDASTTNTLSVITCPNNDCNFTSADVGKIVWTACCGGLASLSHVSSVLTTPQGVITIINGPQSITVSTVSNSTNIALATLVWGNDDTLGLQAAVNAAWNRGTNTNCTTIQLPAGGMLAQSAVGNSLTCINGLTNQLRPGASVQGWSRTGSLIIGTPNFNYSTCTGTNNTCFFAPPNYGIYLFNFGFWGGEVGNTGVASLKNIVSLGLDSYLWNVGIFGWGANDTNLQGILFTGGAPAAQLVVDGAGATACRVSSTNGIITTGSFCGDSKNTNLLVDAGGSAVVSDFVAGPASNSTGTVIVNGTLRANKLFVADGGVLQSMIIVNNGGFAYLENSTALAVTANSAGLACATGSVCHVSHSSFSGNGTGYSTATAGTAKLFDECGNNFGTTLVLAANTVFGSCSTSGAALVAGNVGLTSGWGTSTVASVAAGSDSHAGSFTITGAAGTANPTLTLTFPTPYPIAPSACAMGFGSTGATTDFTNSFAAAPSTTSDVFTLIGTPTAVTITLTYRCGP